MKTKYSYICLYSFLLICSVHTFSQQKNYKIMNMSSHNSAKYLDLVFTDTSAYSSSYNGNNLYYIDSIEKYKDKPLSCFVNALNTKYALVSETYWMNGEAFWLPDSLVSESGFSFGFKYNDSIILFIDGIIPDEFSVPSLSILKMNYFMKQTEYYLICYTEKISKVIEFETRRVNTKNKNHHILVEQLYMAYPNYRNFIDSCLTTNKIPKCGN